MNQLSPQDRKTLDSFRGMTVGQIFRKAREAQGYEIAPIATHLNISAMHIEAIENDNVNALPPKVYAVGFVRAYADLLQLDSEKMAYLFKVQCYGKRQTDEQKKIVRPDNKTIDVFDVVRQKANAIPAIVISVVGIVLVLSVFVVFVGWIFDLTKESKSIVPEVPAEMLVSEDDEPQNEAAEENEEVVSVSKENVNQSEIIRQSYGEDPRKAELAFKMTDKNWVEFRNVKGEVLFSKKFEKDDVYYVPKGQDVLITTGNAGAVEIFLDGQLLGVLGQNAEIIRLRPFSAKALRLQ